MRVSVRITGLDIEEAAMKKAGDYFKQKGHTEELWDATHEASPFKTPVEGPIEVGITVFPSAQATPRG